MVAALYLIKAINDVISTTKVRLFEGFLSFKQKGNRSNHTWDVVLLKEVVDDRFAYLGAVVDAKSLKMTKTDILKSVFLSAGIDTGVPPIIMRNG